MNDCDTSRGRGQALTEFALVVPILLLLVFGIFELARFIFDYETLNNAVREGVRYAIVHGAASSCPSEPGYQCPYGSPSATVEAYAFTLNPSDLTVTVCWGAGCSPGNNTSQSAARGTPVTVSATYTWRPLINLVSLPSIVIKGTSTDVINN